MLGQRKGSEWHGPAFSRDGARFTAGAHDGVARIWSTADFTELTALKVGGGIVWDALFNEAGDQLVTASADGLVRIWGHRGMQGGEPLRRPQGCRLRCELQPKRRAGSYRRPRIGTLFVWDVASGRCLLRLEGHEKAVSRANFSPDGSRVLTSSGDGSARIWDGASGTELIQFKGHDNWVSTAAYNHAGDRVVTASSDMTVRVWNAATGTELTRFSDVSPFTSAIFSPSGERILATLAGGAMRIWDVQSEIEIARCERYQAQMSDVALSPDGSLMATTSDDGLIRFWDATWLAGLSGARLVQAAAVGCLKGLGRLSDGELALLRAIVGDVDRDTVSRSAAEDDGHSIPSLDRWTRNRARAHDTARQIWSARAAEINVANGSVRQPRKKKSWSLFVRAGAIALFMALVVGAFALLQTSQ